jgi:hypothetical protein
MRHTGGLLAAALSMAFSWSDGLEARLWKASGLPTTRPEPDQFIRGLGVATTATSHFCLLQNL